MDVELAVTFSTGVKNIWFPSALGSAWSTNTQRNPLEKLYLPGEQKGGIKEIKTPNLLALQAVHLRFSSREARGYCVKAGDLSAEPRRNSLQEKGPGK